MNLDLRYLGTSGLTETDSKTQALSFSPNLARPKVFFDGELRNPVRFREAMSALHEVVIGDLKTRKKDRAAWHAWKAEESEKEAALRSALLDDARVAEARKITGEPLPKNLEAQFREQHRLYWDARVRWAHELAANDPALFRSLVPCDPVVTVAPDVVFFECFAKDESSYGCLTVERDAFGGEGAGGLGTTNVDYSLGLYEHFQTLRSYRATRLLVDPTGFEVATQGKASFREEKIDLPPSWLRGFGQLQAVMALPATRVELSVDVVYSILAYLKRHREKTGPRSLRLSLAPGRAPQITIDPWGVVLTSRGARYDGPYTGEIKLWGRRRLFPLARLLPLVTRFEVLVFGSGMPSIWTAYMGEMRFVLGLSGWTANDWTKGSNLDTFFSGFEAPAGVEDALSRFLEIAHKATLAELERQVGAPRKQVLGGLHHLAKRGQIVYDHAASLYRWRPVMPFALSESVLGPDSPELEASRKLVAEKLVHVTRDTSLPGGRRLLVADVRDTQCEGIVDVDGGFSSAKCNCSHFFKNRLRAGPCRHLLALRAKVLEPPRSAAAPALLVTDRQGLVVHLPEAVLGAIQAEADRRGEQLSAIAAQAWKIARERVRASTSLDALVGPSEAGAYRGSAKVAQLLMLDPATEAEIQREAARLDATVSRVLEASWLVARDVMKLTSSLLR